MSNASQGFSHKDGAGASTLASGQPPRGVHGSSSSSEVVIGDMFLTPRVIDRRAYSEYSSELRELAQTAQQEKLALLAALDQSQRALSESRERERNQQINLELAAKALKALDERSQRVEALLTRASDSASVFQQLEARASAMIESKIQSLEARLEAVTSASTSKVEALEERLRSAHRELEQRIDAIRRDAQSITGPAREHLEDLCAKAKLLIGSPEHPGTLAALVAGADQAQTAASETESQVRDIIERLETGLASANASKTSVDQWLLDARQQIDQLEHRQAGFNQRSIDQMQQLERNLGIIQSRVSERTTAATSQGQAVLDAVQRHIDILTTKASESRSLCEGSWNELAPKLAQASKDLQDRVLHASQQLGASIKQSYDAHNTTSLALRVLEKSASQAQQIVNQLEPWRVIIEGSASAAVQGQSPDGTLAPLPVQALPEPLRRLLLTVREELRADLSQVALALRQVADRTEGALSQGTPGSQAPRLGSSPVIPAGGTSGGPSTPKPTIAPAKPRTVLTLDPGPGALNMPAAGSGASSAAAIRAMRDAAAAD